MAYQCSSCRKITYDIDSPPCGESLCLKFRPIEVLITHFSHKNIIVCSDEQKNNSIRSTHTLVGVNCPACRELAKAIIQTMKDDSLRKKGIVPKPTEPKNEADVYLADLELPAKLIDALFQESVKRENMSIMTLRGLREFVKTESLTSIPGIGDDEQTLLLKTLEKV